MCPAHSSIRKPQRTTEHLSCQVADSAVSHSQWMANLAITNLTDSLQWRRARWSSQQTVRVVLPSISCLASITASFAVCGHFETHFLKLLLQHCVLCTMAQLEKESKLVYQMLHLKLQLLSPAAHVVTWIFFNKCTKKYKVPILYDSSLKCFPCAFLGASILSCYCNAN